MNWICQECGEKTDKVEQSKIRKIHPGDVRQGYCRHCRKITWQTAEVR